MTTPWDDRTGRSIHHAEPRRAQARRTHSGDGLADAPDPVTTGTPPGMTEQDVALRSDLARHLGRAVFPADRAELAARLRRENAPDALVSLVGDLPARRRYDTVQAVVAALGLGTEERRT